MNKVFLFILIFVNSAFSQIYQGPAQGSIPNGVIVSTGSFTDYSEGIKISPFVRKKVRNKINFTPYSEDFIKVPPSAPEGSNYMNDPLINKINKISDPIIFKSYLASLDPGGYIPPDFYVAAGPTHIITTDNGRFSIWDKDGKLIKTINADTWFSSTISGANAFDPKVSYDHFSKRWIMVWLDEDDLTARGNLLISISDDSIPLGTWYNFALPTTVNGTTNSNSWGDYQGVGFDNQAIYVTTNQYAFGGNFQGSRIRIISKADLYANNAGPVHWFDLWDIREPSANTRTFGTRPSVMYSLNSEYYLLVTSPISTGTFVTLYKVTNPLTAPIMTAVNVPVTTYNSPPNANQLGGSSILLETSGSNFRFEPFFKNGFLWAVHSVKNTSYTSYSSIRYLKINTSTNATTEDVAMGANGYWHFYPSLSVDKDNNIAIAYSRSGTTEYVGSYYTSKLNTDPPGLSGSKVIQLGKANYVKDFASGRNRWGDYCGIWLDPSDQNNFWALTQYAETPANTWAGWVAGIRLVPFVGARIFVNKDSLDFGVKEVSHYSDTLILTLSSQGQDTLSITNIQLPNNQFQFINTITYPVKLGFNQAYDLKLRFLPSTPGVIRDTLRIFSNDALNSQKKVLIKAKGYVINPATAGTIYGITGSQSGGSFISLNKNSGAGTLIGLSGFSDISAISIRPSDNTIFGVTPGTPVSRLVRINSTQGDAYSYVNIPLSSVKSIAFDVNNDLFCGTQDGNIFKYNLVTNDTLTIGNTGISPLYSISINPINGQLWGVALNNRIYKINKTNASAVQVGIPGYSNTPSIAFNNTGKLYGTFGLGVQVGNLILYDTISGTASLLGPSGFTALNSIAISQQTVGIENISNEVPESFDLFQNYPNPFNQSSIIKFQCSMISSVLLKLYDVSGREIATLVNEVLQPGVYRVRFDAPPSLSSGIYFYKISAGNFISIRKMILLK